MVLCFTYLVPAEHEESFVADLWQEGTLGVLCEEAGTGWLRLAAYFDAGASSAVPEALTEDWQRRGVEAKGREDLPETDWLAAYREKAQPFAVAGSLVVDPREPEEGGREHVAAPAGRWLLRLPARAAFGIGSHESTALAIELLEGVNTRGLSVLDVGTGTGILSFVALRQGAARVVALDLDPAASFHARDNSRLNSLTPRLLVGRLSALAPGAARRFDLALANIVPEQILSEMPLLVRLLRPGGELVLSGILAARGAEVLPRLSALGLAVLRELRAGEWIAYRCALTAGVG